MIDVPSRLRLIRNAAALTRIFPTRDLSKMSLIVVYYESIKRDLKIRSIYECRCDGRLQTKRFTRLSYTG